jgi:hypothetical protein
MCDHSQTTGGDNVMDFELFKSQLIRSLQDVGHSDAEIEEFRKILNSPTGELIVRAALMAAKKS